MVLISAVMVAIVVLLRGAGVSSPIDRGLRQNSSHGRHSRVAREHRSLVTFEMCYQAHRHAEGGGGFLGVSSPQPLACGTTRAILGQELRAAAKRTTSRTAPATS